MALKRNCSEDFVEKAKREFPNTSVLTRPQVVSIRNKHKLSIPVGLFKTCKVAHGKFDLSKLDIGKDIERKVVEFGLGDHSKKEMVDPVANHTFSLVAPNSDYSENLVPERDKQYVPWGNFKDVKRIIESNIFAPLFITGLSGNGKTMMVEQTCSQTKREYIRVNITIETDEDDLLGGFRLINGETKWFDGPVPVAMQRGAVLLLDEIDLGGNRLMCLQPVLEGKPIYMKKVNRWVYPKAGFTIVATANTKGKSDDTGNFIGTNVMNEAFLDRFKFTMFQNYPNKTIERNILTKVAQKYKLNTNPEKATEVEDFIEKLVLWSYGSRKSYNDGALNEVITTRRLVNILEAYKIFGKKKKAVEMCLERFDEHTKDAYIDFYKKLDEGIDPFSSDYDATDESEDAEEDNTN